METPDNAIMLTSANASAPQGYASANKPYAGGVEGEKSFAKNIEHPPQSRPMDLRGGALCGGFQKGRESGWEGGWVGVISNRFLDESS
jgi:hypothetical protein